MRKVLAEAQVTSAAKNAIDQFYPDAVAEVQKAVEASEWVIVGMAQNPVVKSARKFLDEKKIQYEYIENGNYFSEWKKRLAIKLWSGWPTFPQVFHKGQLVGGFKELKNYKH